MSSGNRQSVRPSKTEPDFDVTLRPDFYADLPKSLVKYAICVIIIL